ncbi:MAG: DUF2236 domain-containing protein [Myxococcales bacterium]|nr:DUF2236 domain-containing protein [Myxococcales bacterium]
MVWQTQSDLAAARAIAVPGPGSLGALANAAWRGDVPENNLTFLEKFLSVGDAQTVLATFKAGNLLPMVVPELPAILTYASFPATYLHADIACMLASTGRLTDHRTVVPRLLATDERLRKIYSNAQPEHGGLIGAMRLGNLHALFNLPNEGANAMNQVSMAFTLLTFTQVALQSPQLGAPPGAATEGWLKMWNTIGGLMGIVDDGLPPTLDAAGALYQLILASPQCQTLSRAGQALIAAFTQAFPGDTIAEVVKYGGEDLARRLGLIA